jgi:lipopolysaccharide transport system ATP-binding protein
MSQPIAISVENVSKTYRLGTIGSGTLQEDFERFWARLRRRPDPLAKIGQEQHARQVGQHFWALDKVSFDVEAGGVVGIIGRNGAGKSTLLKILSQVTAPTSGKIKVRGRIASLLEVGTGFHPELTGRDNIFLNGAILGMTKAEIRRKLDEIIAFSGVEQFVDTPVKRYSSGMYVRLAFAVAAHLEPEILVVDEVLAVGDAEFQAKCLGKMDEVSRKHGRTVLFVSHNMQAVSALTRRSVLLASGRVAMEGPTADVVAAYLGRTTDSPLEFTAPPADHGPTITRVSLTTSLAGNVQYHGDPMNIECEVNLPEVLDGVRFEITACDEQYRKIMYLWRYDSRETPTLRESGRYLVRCRIPRLHLYAGHYTILVVLAERYGSPLFRRVEGVCPFEVIMDRPRDGGWVHDEATFIEDAEWALHREAPVGASTPGGTV